MYQDLPPLGKYAADDIVIYSDSILLLDLLFPILLMMEPNTTHKYLRIKQNHIFLAREGLAVHIENYLLHVILKYILHKQWQNELISKVT